MTEKQLLKYFQENEFDVQSAIANFFVGDLAFSQYVKSEIFKGVRLNSGYCFMGKDLYVPFYQIFLKKDIYRLAKRIYLEYLKNERNVIKKIEQRTDILKKIEKRFNQKPFSELNERNLKKLLLDLISLSYQWWKYAPIGEDKGLMIDQEIIPAFAKNHNLSADKTREIFSVLSHPDELSVFGLERKEFWSICLYVLEKSNYREALKRKDFDFLLKDIKLQEIINRYINHYFWIKTDFCRAKQITPRDLLLYVTKEIADKQAEHIKTEIEKIETNIKKINEEKKDILLKLKLTKKDWVDLSFSRRYTYWQDQRKMEMMKALYYLFTVVEEVSKRISIGYEELVFRPVKELVAAVNGKKLVERDKEIFLVFKYDKKLKIYRGDWPRKFLDAILKVEHSNELRGMVASKGKDAKFKGVAKIINNPAQDEFREGEILVTSMTRVEFVPLMRKAKAVITNEGGIACHAAIISRELGIPCIIGTKIATKVLKDGDMVEVDAERGIVRLCQKATADK